MADMSPPEELRPEQTQPEPERKEPAEGAGVPVPTHFRRNLWLLAIILGVIVAAWVLAVLWKRVPKEMASLQTDTQVPPSAPAALAPAETSPPAPVPEAPALIVGTKSEVIPASPPVSLTPGAPPYRRAHYFDVTNRIPGFEVAELIRLPSRWADQMEAFTPKPPAAGAQPTFVPVRDAAFLQPQDRVLAVSLGTEVHAYPAKGLLSMVGINDTVGGTKVFVSWSNWTQMARCLVATVDGRETAWQDAGLLYRGNQVCYDAGTGSLWDPFSGQALCGPLAGFSAESVPVVAWQWEAFKAQHPDAAVFAFGLQAPGPRLAQADRLTEAYLEHPYLPLVPAHPNATTSLLPAKAFILGVTLNGKAKAYPLAEIAASGAQVVNDSVAGAPVEVRVTSPRTAYATSEGKLLDARVMLWFSWKESEPETELYSVRAQSAGAAPSEAPAAPAP